MTLYLTSFSTFE